MHPSPYRTPPRTLLACDETQILSIVKKYKEIAEELNISVNTVKTHITTGLKTLRGEFPASLLLLLFTNPYRHLRLIRHQSFLPLPLNTLNLSFRHFKSSLIHLDARYKKKKILSRIVSFVTRLIPIPRQFSHYTESPDRKNTKGIKASL